MPTRPTRWGVGVTPAVAGSYEASTVFGITLAAVVLGERPSSWATAGLAAVLASMAVVLALGQRG